MTKIQTLVIDIPKCDFCPCPASYDAKTKLEYWAYMCLSCYRQFAMYSELGLGKGQLIMSTEGVYDEFALSDN